ncbi:hypothetical protein [Nitrospirillum sp. BR 11163]|uniref:hypothetical protein n=1 Tax=Nitrospirillum sp. BR 11163 TaxID=3104323 RepID=UPI002AFF91C5|nr:hypothetical protein [Nitrospirillum sp. BR 11163]MEA1672998.1 hypothetical protein [Nitrospirillum sp. BR 11163]
MMVQPFKISSQGFHQELIDRAIKVAERKGIIFTKESAEEIRSFALAEADRVVGAQGSSGDLVEQSAGGRDDHVGFHDLLNLPGSWKSLDLFGLSLRIMNEIVEMSKKIQIRMGTDSFTYIEVNNSNHIAISTDAIREAIRNLCRRLGNPWPLCPAP